MSYICILLLIMLPLHSLFSQVLLETSFKFSDGAGEEIILKAGLDSTATDSIDANLGEYELPPLPPLGVFDIRFNVDGTNGTLSDYRHINSKDSSIVTKQYYITYQTSGFSNKLNINYDISSALEFFVTGETGIMLTDRIESGAGTIEIPADTRNFIINIKFHNPLTLTLLNENQHGKLQDFYLFQNYPNPFNSSTIIDYNLSTTSIVSLKIFDAVGHLVKVLVDNKIQNSGLHKVSLNASMFTSGIYFYKVTFNNTSYTKKMLLIK